MCKLKMITFIRHRELDSPLGQQNCHQGTLQFFRLESAFFLDENHRNCCTYS